MHSDHYNNYHHGLILYQKNQLVDATVQFWTAYNKINQFPEEKRQDWMQKDLIEIVQALIRAQIGLLAKQEICIDRNRQINVIKNLIEKEIIKKGAAHDPFFDEIYKYIKNREQCLQLGKKGLELCEKGEVRQGVKKLESAYKSLEKIRIYKEMNLVHEIDAALILKTLNSYSKVFTPDKG